MTKQEFINSVLAEANVLELLPDTDKVVETKGNYEKGVFEVLLNEPQGGKNFRQVWYIRNTRTDETGYQTANTIDVTKNVVDNRLNILEKYLATTFLAYRVTIFTGEKWAEAEVYTDTTPTVTKKKVFVFKQGTKPVAHKELIG